MKPQHIFALLALFVFSLCIIACASATVKPDENPVLSIKIFERDCPACGWCDEKEKSDNTPQGAFIGTFKAGTTCPYCDGAGKLFDIIDPSKAVVISVGVATVEDNETRDRQLTEEQQKLMANRGAKIVAIRNGVETVKVFSNRDKKNNPQNNIQAEVSRFEVIDEIIISGQKKYGAKVIVKIPVSGIR